MVRKRSTRVVFYLNDEEAACLDDAVSAAGMERAAYLRDVLLGASESTGGSTSAYVRVLEEALADARRSKERLEVLLAQSQDTIGNLTLALPAPSLPSRCWWKIW